MTASTSILTVRLDHQARERLEKLAHATDRSKSYVAAQAIYDYLDLHEWQISEIKNGIAEVNAGDLIAHEEIVKAWEKKRENILDKGRKKKSK